MQQRSRFWLYGVATISAVALLVATWGLAEWFVEPDEPGAFYDPPQPIPAGAPGTILRSEAISDAPHGADVARVLYTSTDRNGAPIAVSGIVIVANGAVPRGGRPIVAWAHGTSGVASRCAPSLQDGGGAARIPALAELLEAGAIVVATDYPGLGTPGPHPYLVGVSEGRAVLDSIRAAQNLVGNDASATATVFGHSQGGHATLFAAELASQYAPEIDLVGIAAMAPPTDLAELMVADEGEAAGVVLTAMAIASWSRVYPDTPATAIVHQYLLPSVEDIARKCILTDEQSLIVAPDIFVLRDRFLSTDPVTDPSWKPHFSENSPSDPLGRVPVLIAQGLADEIVRPEVTEAYVKHECADGSNVELRTYADVGHFEVRTTSAPDVSGWLIARIEGEPVDPGCRTEGVR